MAISDNHDHTLTVPAAELDSTVNKTYTLTIGLAHTHMVTLTPAQLTQIKAKTAVKVTSSNDVGHFHEVTINCA